jgi:hypothetical protein
VVLSSLPFKARLPTPQRPESPWSSPCAASSTSSATVCTTGSRTVATSSASKTSSLLPTPLVAKARPSVELWAVLSIIFITLGRSSLWMWRLVLLVAGERALSLTVEDRRWLSRSRDHLSLTAWLLRKSRGVTRSCCR